MEPTNIPLNLYKKLLVCQQTIPSLIKTRVANAKKFGWNYAPLDEIWDAIFPILADNNLFCNWVFEARQTNDLTDQLIVMTVVDLDSGEFIKSEFILLPNESFQDIGGRVTYYLNRLVTGLVGRVAEKDTGGEEEAEDIKPPKRRNRNDDDYEDEKPKRSTRTSRRDEEPEDDDIDYEDQEEERRLPKRHTPRRAQ